MAYLKTNKQAFSSRATAIAAVLFAAAALSSCVTQSGVQSKENDLVAAGFVAKPANTSARQAMLKRLPANKFLMRSKGDNVNYVYADPTNCNCLYVGTEQAYGKYRQAQQQERIANRQLWAAQTYADARWNWGAWGPGDFYNFDGPFGAGYGW